MTKMDRRIAATGCSLALAVALSGCVVIWKDFYTVESASPDAITLDSDPGYISMEDAQKIADRHCRKYDKVAVLRTSETSSWGLRTISYRCVKPQT